MALFPLSRGQEGCKNQNTLQKGDRFSVPLFTRVGARHAACGFGFEWAAGLVSVTVWLRFLLRVALVPLQRQKPSFRYGRNGSRYTPRPRDEGLQRAYQSDEFLHCLVTSYQRVHVVIFV